MDTLIDSMQIMPKYDGYVNLLWQLKNASSIFVTVNQVWPQNIQDIAIFIDLLLNKSILFVLTFILSLYARRL